MHRHILATALLSATLITAGCSSTGSDAADGAGTSPMSGNWSGAALTTADMDTADAAKIDEATEQSLTQIEQGGATGMWIGVWDPEKGRHLTAAGTVAKDGDAATVEDHSRIGSVTKTFTATGILQQVAGGNLALSDTVAIQLPELAGKYPELAPITIEQLLNMTSGIPDYANRGLLFDEIFSQPDKTFTTDEIVGKVLDKFEVKKNSPEYSTTGYLILGEILAKATGKSTSAAVTDVASGLGLEQTALPAPEDSSMPDPSVTGYLGKGALASLEQSGFTKAKEGVAPDNPAAWGAAGGGMYSVVEDLGTWAGTGLGTATLPQDLGDQRISDTHLLAEGICYGMGIMDFGNGWIGHSGQTSGYEAQVVYNTETGAAFVAMVNEGGSLLGAFAVMSEVFPDAAADVFGLGAPPCTAESGSEASRS